MSRVSVNINRTKTVSETFPKKKIKQQEMWVEVPKIVLYYYYVKVKNIK